MANLADWTFLAAAYRRGLAPEPQTISLGLGRSGESVHHPGWPPFFAHPALMALVIATVRSFCATCRNGRRPVVIPRRDARHLRMSRGTAFCRSSIMPKSTRRHTTGSQTWDNDGADANRHGLGCDAGRCHAQKEPCCGSEGILNGGRDLRMLQSC